ncbi:hypothetical protein ElyMa_000938300 [Elysia marginata]|uniref:Uncharacterized protein n=1 Tax=Elysia marginata TaxID=1093978 RepID=A0AAV4HBY4_9GAST|nr:hypothetical protein ElyMa_000938300 [Elysia marginata]
MESLGYLSLDFMRYGPAQEDIAHSVRNPRWLMGKRETEMVWAHYSLIWPCQDHHAGRRRGGQKKRWEDNIKDWTELEQRNALRKDEDRQEWKTVVRRSSMRPDGSQI